MREIKDNKRMTWDEIVKEYPDTYIAISDGIYEDDQNVNVKSAIVRYVSKDFEEIFYLCMNNATLRRECTAKDDGFHY